MVICSHADLLSMRGTCRRGGLEPEAPAGTAWATSSPLLIMSSHAWAQPSPRNGKIMSEGNGRVLAAAAKRSVLVAVAGMCLCSAGISGPCVCCAGKVTVRHRGQEGCCLWWRAALMTLCGPSLNAVIDRHGCLG